MSDTIDNSNMEYQNNNIPLTELQRTYRLTDNDLLLISQYDDAQYNTKTITYKRLSQIISSDFELSSLIQQITEASNVILNNTGITTKVGSESNPQIIYGIKENNMGVITDISSISLKDAMTRVFNGNVFNQISARNSPWILTSDIVNDIGTNINKVASQKLVHDLSNNVDTKYVKKSDIVNDVNNSSIYKVASQKLIKSLSDEVQTNFIDNSRIETDITSINTTDNTKLSSNVASIELLKQLSDIVDTNYVKQSQIVSYMSEEPSTTKVASEKLVYDLNDTISKTYILANQMENFIPLSSITDVIGSGSSIKVASQKLAKGLSDEINAIFPSGKNGEVYFATRDTVTEKTSITNKTLMDLNVFVCENNDDLNDVINFPNITMTRNMFADWEIGSFYRDKWYGYDNDFGGSDLLTKGYANWERLDSNPKIIKQKINTGDYTFCTTPYATDNFDITLSVKSTNDDDDMFGIVASYIEDENGRPHTLTFLRHGGHQASTYLGNDGLYTFACLCDRKICAKLGTEETSANWNDTYPGGVAMRVIRDGNKLSAITGEPVSNGYTASLNYDDPIYRIELDLEKLTISPGQSDKVKIDSDAISNLTLFKDKPGKIGVYNFSQADTYYTFPQFNTEKIVIMADSNQISSCYVDANGNNVLTPIEIEQTPQEYVGIGRFTKNTITNKTFYVTQSGFIKVSELN